MIVFAAKQGTKDSSPGVIDGVETGFNFGQQISEAMVLRALTLNDLGERGTAVHIPKCYAPSREPIVVHHRLILIKFELMEQGKCRPDSQSPRHWGQWDQASGGIYIKRLNKHPQWNKC